LSHNSDLAMEPADPSDFLALRSSSGFAPDMQQAIQLLSRGNPGRSTPGVAECLMRIKEIDGQTQVEQCRLSESGMTERQRIVEEQRSKRYECLAEVIQASVKEGAVTTRQAISARAEVSKQTIKGNVQIEESRNKAQTSSNLWQWALLTFVFVASMASRGTRSGRRSGHLRRLFHLLPWLILGNLAWRKVSKMQMTLWQLSMMSWQSLLSLDNLRGPWSFWRGTDLVQSKSSNADSLRDSEERASPVNGDKECDGASPASPDEEEPAFEPKCTLQQFLQPAGLEAYVDSLSANGYDVEVLNDLDSADQEEMLQTISCLPGHKVKFRKLLLRSQSQSQSLLAKVEV